MFDEQAVRTAWGRLRGATISDDLWSTAKGAHYGDADTLVCASDADAEAAAIEETIARLTDAKASHTVTWDPPASWARYCAAHHEEHRDIQQNALAVLEMRGFVPSTDVHDLLRNRASHRRNSGTPTTLFYFAYGRMPDGRAMRYTEAVLVYPGQPLHTFARIATGLAEDHAIRPEHAIEYLLADVPLQLPWVTARWSTHERVTLVVGSFEVRPEEVAAAYASARRQAVDWMNELSWPRVGYKRAADAHAELLQHFESCLEAGGTQRNAAESWKWHHPGDSRRADSIIRTYRRYRDKGGR